MHDQLCSAEEGYVKEKVSEGVRCARKLTLKRKSDAAPSR